MLRCVLLFAVSLASMTNLAVSAPRADSKVLWQAKLESALPLLGHRNWILIVDSAYPLQTSPGIETVETNADQTEVIRAVMSELDKSIHVSPVIYMDAELPFVPEQGAPGVTAYRAQVAKLFSGREIQSLPHEQVIAKIDEAGKTFHILVLKTKMTIPYTSVFLQLGCKYWGAEAEQQLRQKMSSAASK